MVTLKEKVLIEKSKEAVTIPEFNHTTIQSLLTINENLIKILANAQNNAWSEEEQHIYQARLHSNIVFLASMCQVNEITNQKVTHQEISAEDRKGILEGLRLPCMIKQGGMVPPFGSSSKDLQFSGFHVLDRSDVLDVLEFRQKDCIGIKRDEQSSTLQATNDSVDVQSESESESGSASDSNQDSDASSDADFDYK